MEEEISELKKRIKSDQMRLQKLEMAKAEEKKEKYLKCDCLLCITKKGYWSRGFHSSDYEWNPPVYRCVKCGLTNDHGAYRIENSSGAAKLDVFLRSFSYSEYIDNIYKDQVFIKKFGSIDPKIENINLISKEEFKTRQPDVFYQYAKELNPEASNEELFEIMESLLAKVKNVDIARDGKVLIK